jgi:hypothetical protein
MDVGNRIRIGRLRHIMRGVCSFALMIGLLLPAVNGYAAGNLLVNGDFSKGSDNQPTDWKSESWIDLPTTTFTWIPPVSGEPGELEISNAQLNDSRWTQSVTLSPGLYYAGAEISTHGVPVQSWAGALVSIGDQSVASMDVKGNSYSWDERGAFFTVNRPNTKVDVKVRLAGFKNFAVGQAYFRNAVLYKLDSAPPNAMVLDLDADTRLWAGNPWTLLPVWLLLLAAMVAGWRMLGTSPIISEESPGGRAGSGAPAHREK